MNFHDRNYDDKPVSPELLMDRLKVDLTALIEIYAAAGSTFKAIDTLVRNCIIEVCLNKHSGNQSKAAIDLGINRGSLRKYIKEAAEAAAALAELNDVNKLNDD